MLISESLNADLMYLSIFHMPLIISSIPSDSVRIQTLVQVTHNHREYSRVAVYWNSDSFDGPMLDVAGSYSPRARTFISNRSTRRKLEHVQRWISNVSGVATSDSSSTLGPRSKKFEYHCSSAFIALSLQIGVEAQKSRYNQWWHSERPE